MSNQPEEEGQVSEVSGMGAQQTDADGEPTPISDGDSIGGSPSQESGEVETGDELGPAARTGREDRPSTEERTSRFGSKKDL